MKPEIEAKFLNINHAATRIRLQELGAQCLHPMRLMKRKNYDFPKGQLAKKGGWVRLRDEGGKVTLAYKQLNDRTLLGTQEVSLEVASFEQADAFLQATGLSASSYQETKRESWRLGRLEIELDEWPWARPYLEMEGPNEAVLKGLAEKMQLNWDEVYHGSVEVVYQAEYDLSDEDFRRLSLITFEEPLPAWLEKRRR